MMEFVNWDDDIPNISGKMTKMATKPPTSIWLCFSHPINFFGHKKPPFVARKIMLPSLHGHHKEGDLIGGEIHVKLGKDALPGSLGYLWTMGARPARLMNLFEVPA